VDAIAAASIVLTYVLPHLGGVGDDFLALVHRGGRVEAVVGFGWAPRRVPKRPPRRGFNLPWSQATWRGFTNSTDAMALCRGSA
jgi:gamma-glutamyltranspeptidase